jgi:hypothetical protein
MRRYWRYGVAIAVGFTVGAALRGELSTTRRILVVVAVSFAVISIIERLRQHARR